MSALAAYHGLTRAVWTAAAVAAMMRNPGFALPIATLNRAQPAVSERIIGYAIGLAIAIVANLQWRKRAGTMQAFRYRGVRAVARVPPRPSARLLLIGVEGIVRASAQAR